MKARQQKKNLNQLRQLMIETVFYGGPRIKSKSRIARRKMLLKRFAVSRHIIERYIDPKFELVPFCELTKEQI